ncbi:MAG: GTPase HflX [Thermoplasmata archaeon M11B2D]|nr:MAG: GTPase HflX [Thermoplasmata archaeon M11B2D]PNX52998.1 MAG: GTPase HflX [Thermoplasmata archaeon M9B2D]
MHANQKKAILISLDDSTEEIKQLAKTLGYTILKEFIQHRTKPDVNFYIGSGKVDEIKEFYEQTDTTIDLAIVNGELKPSQWFTLEKKLKTNVYDRIRLILAIFEEHAERREALLQVKLAQLQYERPYVRELIHRTKAGEHPGLMAGGEYQVDDYYEMIKRQTKKIREDLQKIRENRELHRQTRTKSGFYSISLAGYTNAGKSSLMNLLSAEKVKVEEQLFSTLSTTTRSITTKNKEKNIPILLTDTVGFIENLPTYIIDAFHSTLEEIELADVVVLVVDASEAKEIVEKKLHVSINELRNIGVGAPIIIALNKIDLITPAIFETLQEYLINTGITKTHKIVALSVKEQKNIEQLLQTIYDTLPHLVKITFHFPPHEKSQRFISELYKKTKVIHITYSNVITVEVECNEKIKEKLIAAGRAADGTVG